MGLISRRGEDNGRVQPLVEEGGRWWAQPLGEKAGEGWAQPTHDNQHRNLKISIAQPIKTEMKGYGIMDGWLLCDLNFFSLVLQIKIAERVIVGPIPGEEKYLQF